VLGELALRVNDLEKMKAFYRDVVGFPVFNEEFDEFVFLKVGEGVDGHPQVLGLFDRSTKVGQRASTLDHVAFVIALDDYATERERLTSLGVVVVPREFPHFHWRSLFFADPEGNTVEFVAYDPSVTDQPSP
jgi:catechol-2,3-dioxygenase